MSSITAIAQIMLRHLYAADVKVPDEAKLIATAIQAWTLVGGSVEDCRQAIAELRRRYSENSGFRLQPGARSHSEGAPRLYRPRRAAAASRR